jgi:hypothetical protein
VAESPETNPYLAPKVPGDVLELAEGRAPPGFVDQSRIVLALTGLLGLQFLFGAFNALACIALNVAVFDADRETFVVDLTNTLAGVDYTLYLATLIPFGIFLVRANKSASALCGFPLEYTPASMVWWFAVPLANLIKPLHAVRAVWDASAPASGSASSGHGLLTLWWSLWIAASVGTRIGNVLTRDAEPEFHNFISTMTNGVGAGLALAAWLMVRALDERQRRRAAEFRG